ncbi:hypothetical protein QAD02_021916 [Eretmocerus hayati]|uniref:Uncharacterized protein n=1 Tax=Eretmocerus hayati TaxID=131215 RepID=A0ACC2PRU1_9HYME|nr:hypothetical protein QAD02_021916 [Eretmocerus hayati]
MFGEIVSHPVQKNGTIGRRYARHDHLKKFDWLVFSDAKQGYFCKYCPFVSSGVAGINKNTPLNKLVTKPLTSFAKVLGAKGDFMKHSEALYHLEAVKAGKKLLSLTENPKNDVIDQLDSDRLDQIRSNRLELHPIVETTVFLGRQNIPFRAHRDDGPLEFNLFKEAHRLNDTSSSEILELKITGQRLGAVVVDLLRRLAVRNSAGTMKESLSYFRASAKRADTIRLVIGKIFSVLCETRWVERHDTVLQFRDLLPEIVVILARLATLQDSRTSTKARILKLAISDGECLVTLVCLSNVVSCTRPLSLFPQKKNTDVKSAKEMVNDVTETVEMERAMSTGNFDILFQEIE